MLADSSMYQQQTSGGGFDPYQAFMTNRQALQTNPTGFFSSGTAPLTRSSYGGSLSSMKSSEYAYMYESPTIAAMQAPEGTVAGPLGMLSGLSFRPVGQNAALAGMHRDTTMGITQNSLAGGVVSSGGGILGGMAAGAALGAAMTGPLAPVGAVVGSVVGGLLGEEAVQPLVDSMNRNAIGTAATQQNMMGLMTDMSPYSTGSGVDTATARNLHRSMIDMSIEDPSMSSGEISNIFGAAIQSGSVAQGGNAGDMKKKIKEMKDLAKTLGEVFGTSDISEIFDNLKKIKSTGMDSSGSTNVARAVSASAHSNNQNATNLMDQVIQEAYTATSQSGGTTNVANETKRISETLGIVDFYANDKQMDGTTKKQMGSALTAMNTAVNQNVASNQYAAQMSVGIQSDSQKMIAVKSQAIQNLAETDGTSLIEAGKKLNSMDKKDASKLTDQALGQINEMDTTTQNSVLHNAAYNFGLNAWERKHAVDGSNASLAVSGNEFIQTSKFTASQMTDRIKGYGIASNNLSYASDPSMQRIALAAKSEGTTVDKFLQQASEADIKKAVTSSVQRKEDMADQAAESSKADKTLAGTIKKLSGMFDRFADSISQTITNIKPVSNESNIVRWASDRKEAGLKWGAMSTEEKGVYLSKLDESGNGSFGKDKGWADRMKDSLPGMGQVLDSKVASSQNMFKGLTENAKGLDFFDQSNIQNAHDAFQVSKGASYTRYKAKSNANAASKKGADVINQKLTTAEMITHFKEEEDASYAEITDIKKKTKSIHGNNKQFDDNRTLNFIKTGKNVMIQESEELFSSKATTSNPVYPHANKQERIESLLNRTEHSIQGSKVESNIYAAAKNVLTSMKNGDTKKINQYKAYGDNTYEGSLYKAYMRDNESGDETKGNENVARETYSKISNIRKKANSPTAVLDTIFGDKSNNISGDQIEEFADFFSVNQNKNPDASPEDKTFYNAIVGKLEKTGLNTNDASATLNLSAKMIGANTEGYSVGQSSKTMDLQKYSSAMSSDNNLLKSRAGIKAMTALGALPEEERTAVINESVVTNGGATRGTEMEQLRRDSVRTGWNDKMTEAYELTVGITGAGSADAEDYNNAIDNVGSATVMRDMEARTGKPMTHDQAKNLGIAASLIVGKGKDARVMYQDEFEALSRGSDGEKHIFTEARKEAGGKAFTNVNDAFREAVIASGVDDKSASGVSRLMNGDKDDSVRLLAIIAKNTTDLANKGVQEVAPAKTKINESDERNMKTGKAHDALVIENSLKGTLTKIPDSRNSKATPTVDIPTKAEIAKAAPAIHIIKKDENNRPLEGEITKFQESIKARTAYVRDAYKKRDTAIKGASSEVTPAVNVDADASKVNPNRKKQTVGGGNVFSLDSNKPAQFTKDKLGRMTYFGDVDPSEKSVTRSAKSFFNTSDTTAKTKQDRADRAAVIETKREANRAKYAEKTEEKTEETGSGNSVTKEAPQSYVKQEVNSIMSKARAEETAERLHSGDDKAKAKFMDRYSTKVAKSGMTQDQVDFEAKVNNDASKMFKMNDEEGIEKFKAEAYAKAGKERPTRAPEEKTKDGIRLMTETEANERSIAKFGKGTKEHKEDMAKWSTQNDVEGSKFRTMNIGSVTDKELYNAVVSSRKEKAQIKAKEREKTREKHIVIPRAEPKAESEKDEVSSSKVEGLDNARPLMSSQQAYSEGKRLYGANYKKRDKYMSDYAAEIKKSGMTQDEVDFEEKTDTKSIEIFGSKDEASRKNWKDAEYKKAGRTKKERIIEKNGTNTITQMTKDKAMAVAAEKFGEGTVKADEFMKKWEVQSKEGKKTRSFEINKGRDSLSSKASSEKIDAIIKASDSVANINSKEVRAGSYGTTKGSERIDMVTKKSGVDSSKLKAASSGTDRIITILQQIEQNTKGTNSVGPGISTEG